jgi:hypothetical protein
VVHALRNLRAALRPGGVVLDTQPLSPRPPIVGEAGEIGTLDMTEWAGIVGDVDDRVAAAVAEGLFAIEDERRFTVTDEYDDGAEFVSHASGWVGTRIDRDVERRAARERGPVLLHQEIRLRVLRAPAGP